VRHKQTTIETTATATAKTDNKTQNNNYITLHYYLLLYGRYYFVFHTSIRIRNSFSFSYFIYYVLARIFARNALRLSFAPRPDMRGENGKGHILEQCALSEL